MIEVDVWADVRCPWCWIGSRRLRRVSAEIGAPLAVRRRSFLLEPEGPTSPGRTTAQVATSEWGMTLEQWETRSRQIRAEGRTEGLDIDIDDALTFDSNPAHRLLLLAAASDAVDTDSAWDSAFEARFDPRVDLGDPETLRRLAAGWGLDASDVESALTGERFAAEVAEDLDEARRSRVTSVPTIMPMTVGGSPGSLPPRSSRSS